MDKEAHKQTIHEFLGAYLVLGSMVLGLFVVFLFGYRYPFERDLEAYLYIIFVFIVPGVLLNFIYKRNFIDPIRDEKTYRSSFYRKNDFICPIYFYIYIFLTIVPSIGVGVMVASLFLV